MQRKIHNNNKLTKNLYNFLLFSTSLESVLYICVCDLFFTAISSVRTCQLTRSLQGASSPLLI
jgi:hypothetical protein